MKISFAFVILVGLLEASSAIF